MEDGGRAAFGTLLRYFRVQADLSQEALAERARMSAESIGALERGARRSPYRETVRLLADALVLSADDRTRLETAAARPQRARARQSAPSGKPVDPNDAATPGAIETLWSVPDAMRTPYFIGREHLLARLRAQLLEFRRAALSGLGGVGKTQAAIQYAIRHRADYPGGVLWANAETTGDLVGGFVEIARRLGLAAANQKEVVGRVLDWLGKTDRWLLILDNVDDRLEVRPFMPEAGKGDVLITSRESVLGDLGIPRALAVGDLTGDEATRFLFARTGRDADEPAERAAAAELATELGNLPLALEQAAAYIAETNAAFADYVSAFRRRRVTLLEKASELMPRDTVAETWAPNFEAAERASPAAAEALRVSAFLAPVSIPFSIFSKGAQALGGAIAEAVPEADELAINVLLRPLTRYSLVCTDATSRSYGVHRLVQEIVRGSIDEADRPAGLESISAAVDAAFPAVQYATWAECDRLVPHVASIARWIDTYDVHSQPAGRLLGRTGWYLRERGRYAEAEILLQQALTILEHVLGHDHAEVADNLNRLGCTRWDQARYPEAETLHVRALAIRERALGSDHPDVAQSLQNLAHTIWEQGRYAEAQPLYERALDICERALGRDHPTLALCLEGLGNVQYVQGRYDEARRLYERALAIRERALGPDDPHVAHSLNNIANVYLEQSRYAEARPLYTSALNIRERALGSDHPDVAASLANLAELARKEGRHSEAQPLYQRALVVWERGLGPDHPDLTYGLEGLASIHLERAQYNDAEPLLERALAIHERALGPNHPTVARVLVALAALRKAQGSNAEALVLLERALLIHQRTFADGHPDLEEVRRDVTALRAATPKRADELCG
jgi:tetratricopeptide (TPR) repeat protein/transcriptional regulator with XRE-family HTH domain